MADDPGRAAASTRPPIYRIRIEGHLPPRLAERFGGLAVALDESGDTLLTGAVADQAALHALLRAVRDLGAPLVSVVRIGFASEPGSDRLRAEEGGGDPTE